MPMKTREHIFSKNLIKLRESLTLTQHQLAEQLGYSIGAIKSWEQSEKFPRSERLKAIAEFFGVSVADLLSDQTVPPCPVDYLHRVFKMASTHAEIISLMTSLPINDEFFSQIKEAIEARLVRLAAQDRRPL